MYIRVSELSNVSLLLKNGWKFTPLSVVVRNKAADVILEIWNSVRLKGVVCRVR